MWDADIGDEGVRAMMQFMLETECESVKLLEFLNCGITSLGCEFIGRMLDPNTKLCLEILNLDYNQFGNEGLGELLIGLKSNKNLTYLSLAYCKIEADGMTYFKEYLSDPECTLTTLVLQGNEIGNKGVSELSQMLVNNNSIESLNLNNVQLGNNEETINNLVSLMMTNVNIYEYKLKYNLITSDGKIAFNLDFEKILKAYKGESCKHVYELEVDERIPKVLFDDYIKAKKSHKKPKKKPAKKGKKGKKK
jgi:Ran GTPase-activating protein (RanGAP) involved in mRNA processing and transport